ncbi:putative Monovalent cation:proton antiporter [Hibiscus syriacus]|uniref:Monovalent cation:proton antiporter n=1 Tax=Hibiscus syriacus TaxID=106335 RepID=A0A6A3CI31_HIBSY|nr:aspartic proteinase nepenthesin-1-like [Hibiscus syriacus]KAE8726789.1 putative Monovalent cation:proton antiporter [Hibiscus syriacus]
MSSSLGFVNVKVLFYLCVTLVFQHHFAYSTANRTGLTLKACVDDSPGSPMFRIQDLSVPERIERLINVSNARANYLYLMSSLNGTILPDNIRIPILRDGLFYIVTFSIGSPAHRVKLLLDTGSGLIWTQCEPCLTCFKQLLPIFDSRASSSYATLPCTHPLCNGERRPYSCVNNRCVYQYGYLGGASTAGVMSSEDFIFYIDEYHMQTFENVVFGCGNDNDNIFFQNTAVSGIFGLNFAPESMMQQFAAQTRSRYSYCLVPFTELVPDTLLLKFGQDIPELPHAESTLFVQRAGDHHFFVELLDISVGDYRLGLPPSAFQSRGGGQGGCIIDSVSLFTLIDSNSVGGMNPYERVMQVFRGYYGSKGFTAIPTRPGGLELCYNIPPNFNDFASLTFHFNGADYTVPGEYAVFYTDATLCIPILKGTGITIVGAVHQQNKRLVYDGMFDELQFADEICRNDR